jgi:hypothetical protein
MPMELSCKCGHIWAYKGKSEHYATCPRCHNLVNVKKAKSLESTKKEAVTDGPIDPARLLGLINKAAEGVENGKPVAVDAIIKSSEKGEPTLTYTDVVKLFGVTPVYKRITANMLCFTPEHHEALIAKSSAIIEGLCDGSMPCKSSTTLSRSKGVHGVVLLNRCTLATVPKSISIQSKK